MSRGLVLVIEDDEESSRGLAAAIRAAGLEAIERRTAKSGLETACSAEPEAIICSIDLPDADGHWVARSVRTQPGRVAVTPFLFLVAHDDRESKLEGFHVGADVTMTKPYRVDEVVAQVNALVQMAERLRHRRDSLAAPPSSSTGEPAAVEGDLAQMSIATILTVLDMERRTGRFRVVSKKRVAELDVIGGAVASATIGGAPSEPIEVIRAVLAWTVGRFSFRGRPDSMRPPDLPTIAALLLDAVRLQDEGRHDGSERDRVDSRRLWMRLGTPSLERSAAPSFGGPPSTSRDTKPPSRASRSPSRAASEAPEIDVDEVEEVIPSTDVVLVDPEPGAWPTDDPVEQLRPIRPALPPPAATHPKPELARVPAPPRPAPPRPAPTRQGGPKR
jgi:DNA-binding response OmpR family regulator